jgi:hypothetical protein
MGLCETFLVSKKFRVFQAYEFGETLNHGDLVVRDLYDEFMQLYVIESMDINATAYTFHALVCICRDNNKKYEDITDEEFAYLIPEHLQVPGQVEALRTLFACDFDEYARPLEKGFMTRPMMCEEEERHTKKRRYEEDARVVRDNFVQPLLKTVFPKDICNIILEDVYAE